MARFRGTVKGNRGAVSRLGHSSMMTHNNGWDQGVIVSAYKEIDIDVHSIMITGGSNGKRHGFHLGHVVDGEFKPSECLIELIKKEYL